MTLDLATIAARADRHHREAILPLWTSSGFDPATGAFEERLDFDRRPVIAAPRRAMVQARQIAVAAHAALSGRLPAARDLALTAAHRLVATHLEADGAPGWVFSVDRDGRVVDAGRDLYAHAFVLYGFAWALRLDRDPAFVRAVDATLGMIDGPFADPLAGGCWDALPRTDRLRRQNPHMHLFEALLALHETTGRADVLDRARHLHRLATTRFLDMATGALREEFDDDWRVHPAPGAGRVEPGHLFEWAWLLRRWEAASGEDQSAAVAALLRPAIAAGLDRGSGRIVDEISEDGRLVAASSRAWPHAEALKALVEEAARGGTTLPAGLDAEATIAAVLARLCDAHLGPDLAGGWIDHLDAADRPLSRAMPASTLYHVHFGLAAAIDFAAARRLAGTPDPCVS